ncbi:S8 family serine peptidase [Nakamurella endophytica]|uniref:Peptidase S8 n=1 Tax=Nakamurella endophytica TaxID=1748367 RepID=A0A917T1H6_9ACTN|nr:S8 family serine peptidase [Nakamurella endophytica]GGM05668.1 peptidase S8 [Nakamurella endophytica]
MSAARRPSRRPSVRTAATLGAVLAATTLLATAPAAEAGPARPSASAGTPAAAASAGTATPLARAPRFGGRAGQRTTVFVRTTGPGALAVDVAAKAGAPTTRRTSTQALQRAAAVTRTTSAIAAAARSVDPSARTVYTTEYTVPGVALQLDAAAVDALSRRPDVVSVTPVVRKHVVDPVTAPAGGAVPANAASDVYSRALDAWRQTGRTGSGVSVAIIDTGLDYTHVDFGGPGTSAQYDQARGTRGAPARELYDAAKFKGGTDFAGPVYNADPDADDYDPIPSPDANPIDGSANGHGTHVAGTLAGYGVTADGATFRGDYGALTAAAVAGLRIGPGSAPQAGLYGLKVFGDNGGSTDLTGEALDWVGQQLTRGTRIDIVNMSLGSDFAPPDDPDNAKLAALVAQGVLPVVAAGNAGDVTDVGGSPGNAAAALTVAAADRGAGRLDGVAVTEPAALAGASPYAAQYSTDWVAPLAVDAPVAVPAANPTGCSAFSTADRARLRGRVAWLTYDDAAPACPSATAFANARSAGAVGVLLAGTADNPDYGISGTATLPGAELTRRSAVALRPAATAGTLRVSFRDDLRNAVDAGDPTATDTLADFSSRGTHGSYAGIVKPDVAAPGVDITSAASGSGTGSLRMSGTSMATPHVAGIAALVRQAHPDWGPLQIKTVVMNTASRDLHDAAGHSYGPLRQGTGLVDALAAVRDTVTVASPVDGALVTASFGIVPVGTSRVEQVRTLTVRNTGSTAQRYVVRYSPRVVVPGVEIRLDRSVIDVPARGTAAVRVVLRIPSQAGLRRTIDPTQQAVQEGVARDYVTAATGVVTLTPTAPSTAATPPLRLSVVAVPQPYSQMHGTPVTFPNESAATTLLRLTGSTLAVGSGPARYRSQVVPFVLGAASPRLDLPAGSAVQTARSLDLKAVGAVSTAPLQRRRSTGMLAFGIQTWGATASPGTAGTPWVFIDVDGDDMPDYATTVQKYGTADIAVAATYTFETGDLVDVQRLDANGTGLDANLFDSGVMVLPVSLSRLGFTDTSTRTRITYQVVTASAYSSSDPQSGLEVDETPPVSFDVYRPALWFGQTGSPAGALVLGDTSRGIQVHRSTMATLQALLLHLQNRTGDQADIVTVRTTRSVRPAVGHRPSVSGKPVVGRTLTAVPGPWTPPGTSFAYSWLRDGVTIGGQHGSRYVVRPADVGHRLSVKVVGRKAGYNTGVAVSGALPRAIG